jgi:hypothetical protein
MTGLFVFVLFLMLLAIIAWLIVEYGKRNLRLEQEYERCHDLARSAINHLDINEVNYDYITKLLINLGQLKWKDREKTEVLTMTFFRKYEKMPKRLIYEETE